MNIHEEREFLGKMLEGGMQEMAKPSGLWHIAGRLEDEYDDDIGGQFGDILRKVGVKVYDLGDSDNYNYVISRVPLSRQQLKDYAYGGKLHYAYGGDAGESDDGGHSDEGGDDQQQLAEKKT